MSQTFARIVPPRGRTSDFRPFKPTLFLDSMTLSILMPVYNERATLALAVKEVLNVNFPCDVELVIVDDGSTDGTRDLYGTWAGDPRVSVHLHDRNQGKGASIATAAGVAGFSAAAASRSAFFFSCSP